MYSFQPLRYGIYLDNSHNSNIYNNSVMGWGVDESSGIYISSSNNTTISNNSLRIETME
jgi:nitrous oxidase accessory protein NosD